MQRSNKSMMDFWSKGMEQSTSMWNTYTQNMQNIWKDQMSATQTVADAQNIMLSRMQDEMKSMNTSFSEMWQKNMGSSYGDSMSNMMNWMCKWSCQSPENWCDMSQTMSKSSLEAQNMMKSALQDYIKKMTKESEGWMKNDWMSAMPMPANANWQEMMNETSNIWPTSATEMMQTSTDWWSNMATNASKMTMPKATAATVNKAKSSSKTTASSASK